MTSARTLRSLSLGREIAGAIANDPRSHSWAVILPGLWGAEDIAEHLAPNVPLLRVDSALSGTNPAAALGAALAAAAAPDLGEPASAGGTESAVHTAALQWASRPRLAAQGHGLPILLLDDPHLLDGESTAMVESLIADQKVRVVTFVPSVEAIPEFLAQLRHAGTMDVLDRAFLSARELDNALRRSLAAPVSSTVLHRMTSLSAGHAVLAERVLRIAQSAGVLQKENGLWAWGADESAFNQELAKIGPEVLSGFAAEEQELLIMLAISGRLPRSWAADRYGEAAVRSLRSQRVIGPDTGGPMAFKDLRITASAVRLAARADVRESESVRLWYTIGRSIDVREGGHSTLAALAGWRARAEGRVDLETVERIVPCAISRSWYQLVIDVIDHTDEATPMLEVQAARSHWALGDVAAALSRLRDVVEHSAPMPVEAEELAQRRRVMRSALLLVRRIGIFHPECAQELVSRVEELAEGPLLPQIDQVMADLDESEMDSVIAAISAARLMEDCEEAALTQLMLGVRLGMRRHSDMGRLVLSALLDDLSRERGSPDVEDAAVALLLLVTLIHGWRTDALRVDVQIWNGRRVSDPALPAVADVVAAIIAMQQDRMDTAFQYAASAAKIFGNVDRFGLHAFASSVAAATSAFVDDEVSRRAHKKHQEVYDDAPITSGLPSLRLVAEGMAAVGSGPPTEVVAAALVQRAAESRDEGEWAQEQQLLLLALLGRSQEAAYATLNAPWCQEPGRSRMIGLLAQALVTSSVTEALDIALMLIEADAAFFGLAILAELWTRREYQDREVNQRIVRAVLEARRRSGRETWLLNLFSGLSVDEREIQVLQGLHRGDSAREIAEKLYLSSRTVESVVSGLLRRFSCSNRLELLALDLLQD